MAEDLPPEMNGRSGGGFAWERIPDIIRYNRVQGLSLGATMRTRAPVSFTDLYGTIRFGLADERVMAKVAAVRDAPGGRTTLAIARDMIDLDPFARGLTFSNSMRGLLVSRDDGDYALAHGVRVTHELSLGLGREVTLGASAEDHQSVPVVAGGGLPHLFGADADFPANPAVREGAALGVQARIDNVSIGTGWSVMADALTVDGEAGVRVAAEARLPRFLVRPLSAEFRVGVASTTTIPQLGLAAGGLRTVRGFEHVALRGDAMW
jgi:hypothetical protein